MNKQKGMMPNTITSTNKYSNPNRSILNVSTKLSQQSLLKQTTKTFLMCRPSAITVAADTIRNFRTDNKNFTLSTSSTLQADNKHVTAAFASHTNYDNHTSSQPLLAHTSITSLNKNTDNNINFASAAAMEKTPSREHAIVFNSIDGIPQIQYILAIGNILQPKNIKFVSRISNNRFCIFLSNEQILDTLLQTTKHINIQDQIIQYVNL